MQSQLPEEVARLKALTDYLVLDTLPEEIFDRTTRMAAYLCGTPIALLGFIDATRHWFKSRVGWDYPEIPRESSICEQTILQRDLLVIPDAAMDPRFCTGPIVTRAGIRFYAGVPLLTTEDSHWERFASWTACLGNYQPDTKMLYSRSLTW